MQIDTRGSIVSNSKVVTPCYKGGSCGFMQIQATLSMESSLGNTLRS